MTFVVNGFMMVAERINSCLLCVYDNNCEHYKYREYLARESP
jgi:hypothetical protein